MKKFAFISDVVFTFFVGSLISVCIFRHLGINLPLSLSLALLCGCLSGAAVGSILQAKRKNLYLKKSDETLKEKLLLHLALLSDEGKTQFFQRVLSSNEEEAHRFGRLRVHTKTEFYFLKFTLAPVRADEILPFSRLKTGKRKILLCGQIEDGALALCTRLNISVKTGEWVYAFLKERALLPEQYLGEEESEHKRKRRWKSCFSKSNAKRFLISAALVLLVARLTPFYYYYLLLGFLLLAAAVYTRLFGKTDESKP